MKCPDYPSKDRASANRARYQHGQYKSSKMGVKEQAPAFNLHSDEFQGCIDKLETVWEKDLQLL